jgi:hypothetical protein
MKANDIGYGMTDTELTLEQKSPTTYHNDRYQPGRWDNTNRPYTGTKDTDLIPGRQAATSDWDEHSEKGTNLILGRIPRKWRRTHTGQNTPPNNETKTKLLTSN